MKTKRYLTTYKKALENLQEELFEVGAGVKSIYEVDLKKYLTIINKEDMAKWLCWILECIADGGINDIYSITDAISFELDDIYRELYERF